MNDADSMTLTEAIEVAKRASETEGIYLQAIGRFLPFEELKKSPERWGVAILLASGERKVLWSSLSLSMISPARREPNTKRRPAAAKQSKREAVESRQEVLF